MKKRILLFIAFVCVMAIGLLSAQVDNTRNKDSYCDNSSSDIINPLTHYDDFF